MYGVSLGGAILTHYLINDNANLPYSAVVSYGNVFKPEDTVQNFHDRMWGIYDIGLGFFLNLKIRTLLP